MKNSCKGIALVLFSALMFGSYGVWSKLLGTSFGLFYPGWTRSLIIVVALFPILYFTKQIVLVKKEDWKWLSVFLFFTSFTQAPLLYAFNHIDIGAATLLFFVSMLLTMYIVGFVFLGEKMTGIKLVSFIIACIGLYVTFSFSITMFVFLAAILAVVNGIASGGEISFSKKLSDNYSALYLTWLSWICVALTNGIVSIFVGEIQFIPTFDIFWLYQVLYAFVGIAGFWAIIQALKYTEASISGLLGLLEIVFSIAFGALIFHQGLTGKIVLGAVLIVGAAALPHISELTRKR